MKNFIKNVPEIEAAIGYSFRDKALLRQAFTRTSFCNEARKHGDIQSNEVLEFFGDSVLSVAIVTLLIKTRTERYPHGIKTELAEGDFSNIRSRLSNKTNLSESLRKTGLQKFLLMGEGDAKLGIEQESSVIEDLFESIIGAIYIDSDFSIPAVTAAVKRLLDVSVYTDSDSASPIQSFKNKLQEYCADKKRHLPPPVYKRIGECGPDHDKCYTVACYVDGKPLAQGSGRSIKLAETKAAEAALERLLGDAEC